jgi:hypothetical protein
MYHQTIDTPNLYLHTQIRSTYFCMRSTMFSIRMRYDLVCYFRYNLLDHGVIVYVGIRWFIGCVQYTMYTSAFN